MGEYEYRGFKIVFSGKGSDVYAYKSGKLICTAQNEPELEEKIDDIISSK